MKENTWGVVLGRLKDLVHFIVKLIGATNDGTIQQKEFAVQAVRQEHDQLRFYLFREGP